MTTTTFKNYEREITMEKVLDIRNDIYTLERAITGLGGSNEILTEALYNRLQELRSQLNVQLLKLQKLNG